MGFDYEVDGASGIVISRACGCIGPLDICIHMDRVRLDPRFRAGMRSLVDITDADVDVSMNDVWRIAEHIKQLARVAAQARWAVVAPDDAAFVNFRIFESIVRPIGIDTKIFRSRDKAMDWLADESVPARGQTPLPSVHDSCPLPAAG